MRVEGEDFDADAILGTHPGIEKLTIHNIRKKDLARMAGLARLPLRHLEIRWLAAPDLTEVPLPAGLDTLMLWHSRTGSLAGVERAQSLTWLHYQENSELHDLAPVRDLPNLRRLAIVGGFNGGQKVISLDALTGLKLTHLEMNAVEGANLDLTPVTTLPLEEVDFWGRSFAPAEFAKICAAFPAFYARILDLKDYNLEGMSLCKKCRGLQKEMFLRGKKFLWCPKCSAKGLAKILADFDAMVEQAKADLGL